MIEYSTLIPLFGFITYGLIILAVLTGIGIIKIDFKKHKWLGISSLIFASFHFILIILSNF